MVLGELGKQIETAVQGKDGGLIVKINTGRKLLTVTAINAKGYKAPQQILRLSADESVGFEDVGNDISYKVGDHYLIPSDKSAQEKLEDLQRVLAYLPQDQERSILNLIREPRLELRLQMLEWELSSGGRSGGQRIERGGGGESAGATEGIGRLFGVFPGLGWVVGTPVLCMLLIVVLLFIRTTPQSGGAAKGATGPTGPVASDVSGIERAERVLLSTMSESARPGVQELFNSHHLSGEDALKNPNLAEALLKLELLRLKLLKDTSPDLHDVGVLDDVGKVRDPKVSLGKESLQVSVLAYLGCPTPPTGHPRIAGVDVPGICVELKDAQIGKIRMGFEELTKWASTPDKPAGSGAAK
jgi:hypothetical protein